VIPRIHLRLCYRLALLSPACQHLLVFAARNGAIERRLQRKHQAIALFGGGGDPGFFRPQPDNFGGPGQRRFVGRHRLGAKEDIGAPGLDVQIAGGVVG
jgi:hypothetical protein